MYYAIIADIQKSKEIKNRKTFQDKLQDILQELNLAYENEFASNFTITLGDEFQALFSSPIHILEIIDKLRCSLHPIKLRFGIGVGNILTSIQKDASIGADGPAYWCAREAINSIYKHKKNIEIQFEADVPFSSLVNTSISLCDEIEAHWTTSQMQFVRGLILKYGYDVSFTQKALADEQACSLQSINKKLKATSYYTYIKLRKEICALL